MTLMSYAHAKIAVVIFTPQATIGLVARSVAYQIADLGVMSKIPTWSHTFKEIDREIFSIGCC